MEYVMKYHDTKNLILEKALDLICEHGFVKASIRDIVKAVNVTNSAVYVHFKNKDEILYTIIEEIGSSLLETLSSVIKVHEDPLVCLYHMIFAQVCLLKTNRKGVKIYLEEQYQLPEQLRKQARKQHRDIYNLYYNKLCEIEIKKPGVLRNIDKTVATFSIFAIMNWAYRWYREDGELSLENVAEQLIDIFFHGILSVPGT